MLWEVLVGGRTHAHEGVAVKHAVVPVADLKKCGLLHCDTYVTVSPCRHVAECMGADIGLIDGTWETPRVTSWKA